MRTPWGFIFGFGIAGALASVFFLWSRFCKFGIVRKFAGKNRAKRILLGFIPIAIMGLFMLVSVVNTGIVMIHMSFYWLIAEFIAFIIKKIRHKKTFNIKSDADAFHPYVVGIIVLCFELCYFSAGWFLAHHVFETDYVITTDKDLGTENLRIVQIADSHIGATFDGNGFKDHLKTIQATNPDILVIVGDFIDDETTKEDLILSCEGLAELSCPYGKYYVYGNHDKGYYRKKDFSNNEFEQLLKNAGVTILQDKALLVNDSFYIIGRKDKSDQSRKSISSIMSLLDRSKFSIVLDHQPTDYDAEAASGADLVLSGHTHGGQLIPIKIVSLLMKSNDSTYGLEKRGDTNFIVTSGIGDWSIDFKTGTKAEFCVIDIQKNG
ncbi:MAG: metallophosphoesterase [Lachnospiraceae bacterium]|nr:metallophosphoesterase [Lachnospiraceae bacterium]